MIAFMYSYYASMLYSPQTNKKILLQFINVSNSYDYSYWENASLNLQSYQNLEQITIFTYCTRIVAQTPPFETSIMRCA